MKYLTFFSLHLFLYFICEQKFGKKKLFRIYRKKRKPEFMYSYMKWI